MSGHDDPIDNGGKRNSKGQFVAGSVPNPKGRPKGARNKLGEAFLEDLLEDWELNGKVALAACRESKPDAYIRTVASILPKELNVKVDPLEELSDDELDRRIKQLASEVLGISAASNSEEKEERAEPTNSIPPLH